MSDEKRVFYLVHPEARSRAIEAVKQAPEGYAVRIGPRNRTLDQNAKFHALCADLEKQRIWWMGSPRTADQWKVLLVSGHSIATKEGAEILPGLEGEFVNIRESTATMSRKRGASLIEYTLAFCAQQGVIFNRGDYEN